ncbi:helix-turn-helix transcriptional regulator [Listeria monocytogenes]
MELNEKLQLLRKEKNWTQEQLAEELYVSRTAVSKWENKKGYPSIDSLKRISEIFSISIDELLSGDELISLAENENRKNMKKLTLLFLGIMDILTISLLILPLYGQQEYGFVQHVSLFSYTDISNITRTIYILSPILMTILGVVQIISQYHLNEQQNNIVKTLSLFLNVFWFFLYIASRQTYATALLFLLFIIKVSILINENRIKKQSPL